MRLIFKDEIPEIVYGEALQWIAVGETREATRGHLLDQWPEVEVDQLNDILADALRDAIKQGIEREDIDPSWL